MGKNILLTESQLQEVIKKITTKKIKVNEQAVYKDGVTTLPNRERVVKKVPKEIDQFVQVNDLGNKDKLIDIEKNIEKYSHSKDKTSKLIAMYLTMNYLYMTAEGAGLLAIYHYSPEHYKGDFEISNMYNIQVMNSNNQGRISNMLLNMGKKAYRLKSFDMVRDLIEKTKSEHYRTVHYYKSIHGLVRGMYIIKAKELINQYKNQNNLQEELEEELTYDEFNNSPRLQSLRDAINNNKIVGVAFVKADGSVRAMCFRKYLKSYIPSEKEKTEKQLAMASTHNQITVVDLNLYNKALRETGDSEMASKRCWRKMTLPNVLGFIAGATFVDLRGEEDNNILERYGEEIYNSLTKTMVSAIERNQNQNVELAVEEL